MGIYGDNDMFVIMCGEKPVYFYGSETLPLFNQFKHIPVVTGDLSKCAYFQFHKDADRVVKELQEEDSENTYLVTSLVYYPDTDILDSDFMFGNVEIFPAFIEKKLAEKDVYISVIYDDCGFNMSIIKDFMEDSGLIDDIVEEFYKEKKV